MQIEYMDYYLGGAPISVYDLVAQGQLTQREAKICNRIHGYKYVWRNPQLTQYQICDVLLNKFFSNNGFYHTIKNIIIAHTGNLIAPINFDFFGKLKEKYNLHETTVLSSTGHNCATSLHWLEFFEQLSHLMNSSEFLMILCCDITVVSFLSCVYGVSLFSDGGALAIFSNQNNRFIYIGSYSLYLSDYFCGIWSKKSINQTFHNEYLDNMVNLIFGLLTKYALSINAISAIVPHNISTFLWRQVEVKIGVKQLIFIDNVYKFGHAFNADPYINLLTLINTHRLSHGDYFIMVSVGLGATFTAALFQV